MSWTDHDFRDPGEMTPWEKEEMVHNQTLNAQTKQEVNSDFLNGVPGRLGILGSVGAALFIAADPSDLDGLSDAEYSILKDAGPKFFQVLENLERIKVPENFRLPKGFSSHFQDEVLKDLEIIRSDPEKSKLYRSELRKIMGNKGTLNSMYRAHHDTFSDLTSRIAGTNRTGRFYSYNAALNSAKSNADKKRNRHFHGLRSKGRRK